MEHSCPAPGQMRAGRMGPVGHVLLLLDEELVAQLCLLLIAGLAVVLTTRRAELGSLA